MAKTQEIVVGLDIGTSKVALVAGIVNEGMLQVIGVGQAPNSGIRKGVVIDIDDCVSAISGAIDQAERVAGLPLKHAFVGVGGNQMSVHEAKGVVAVSRADGEISESDIARVLEAARVVAVPPNRDILHVIPGNFAVDGQRGIKDPQGMSGVRLEVEARIVACGAPAMRNLIKCVEQADLQITELVFSPLATAKTLLTKRQKESGVILVNIGAGTTSLIIFEEGDMLHAAILPIGSMHLTNDIAIGLRVSLDVAERIKIKHGAADKDRIKDSEAIPLATFEPEEKEKVERKYVVEIIEARLNELFSMIRDELRKIGKDGMIPAGIVFTGGGAKLEGLVDFAKNYLHLPASLGNPILEVTGLVDELDNPSYATALGLMLWGIEDTNRHGKNGSKLEIHKVGGDLVARARHILGQFLP